MNFLLAFDLKTILIILHLIGLTFGAGGAWISDLLILRFLQLESISQEKLNIVHFLTKIVTAGLLLLWISGMGFLLLYYLNTPEKLANPKIWAKVSIVLILTINGVLLHRFILPILQANIGKSLLNAVTYKVRNLMLFIGSISFVSWVFPLLLGSSKALNFTVPALDILLYYGLVLLGVFLLLLILAQLLVESRQLDKLGLSNKVSMK